MHWISPQDAMSYELKRAGIWSFEFLTSIDDPTIPPYTICIQTWNMLIPEDVRNALHKHKPIGIDLSFVNIPSFTKVCICIGPPAKDCPVHGNPLW